MENGILSTSSMFLSNPQSKQQRFRKYPEASVSVLSPGKTRNGDGGGGGGGGGHRGHSSPGNRLPFQKEWSISIFQRLPNVIKTPVEPDAIWEKKQTSAFSVQRTAFSSSLNMASLNGSGIPVYRQFR